MSLLLSSQPIVVIPELAVRLGLAEAMLLQQIQYWLTKTTSGVEHDGRRWVFNTASEWQQQLPFYSVRTIQSAIASLKRSGVLLVEQLNKSSHDRTNYYAINYESELLCDTAKTAASTDTVSVNRVRKNCGIDNADFSESISPNLRDLTENTTEITTEIKRPCQADELPDAAQPEHVVLEHLNAATGSSFRDAKNSTGRIKARLAEDYTVDDLLLVVDYLTAKWLHDPKMSDYLRPSTLFGPENCAEYFAMAKKWRDSGKPENVNGKWVRSAAQPAGGHWNSAEAWGETL